MADAWGYIDLCKNVIKKAKTVYDISRQILTNFQEQKELLMEKVDFLRNRVKLLQKKLEKEGEETGDDMDGLKDVLGNIQKLFSDIAYFMTDVAGYKCTNLAIFLQTFLSKYRAIQKSFKYFTSELHYLKEDLNDMILDALFLGMGSFDLQQQLLKAQNDLSNDIKIFKNILAGKQLDDPRTQQTLTSTSCETGFKGSVAEMEVVHSSEELLCQASSTLAFPRSVAPVTRPQTVTLSGEELQEVESVLDNFEQKIKEELEQELEKYC